MAQENKKMALKHTLLRNAPRKQTKFLEQMQVLGQMQGITLNPDQNKLIERINYNKYYLGIFNRLDNMVNKTKKHLVNGEEQETPYFSVERMCHHFNRVYTYAAPISQHK